MSGMKAANWSGPMRATVSGVADAAREPLCQLPQQLVARVPAQRVGDGLEALHLRNDQGELALAACGRAKVYGEALVEERAVGKTRDHVVVGQVIELVRLFQVIEREGDVAGELEQQRHFLGVEESALGCSQHEAAGGSARADEGEGDDSLVALCQQIVAAGGQQWVRGDVVTDLRLLQVDRRGNQRALRALRSRRCRS